MEKSCPGKEGHPPSRVNFSERLCEEKVDPFPRANSARARSDCLALTELTRKLSHKLLGNFFRILDFWQLLEFPATLSFLKFFEATFFTF